MMKSLQKHIESRMNKKGQTLGGLSGNMIALVVGIIILVLGVVILQELRDTQGATTEAFDAANESMVAVGNFSDFVPIIVIALAASIVIGLILVGFAFRQRGR